MSSVKSLGDLKPYLPNKVIHLLEILQYFSPSQVGKKDPNFSFCGIIFVEQRFVSYVMNVRFSGSYFCSYILNKFGFRLL